MGTTTPNLSIYVPAAGETNYDQAFLAGMLNVDAHDHTGGPDNGVVLGTASIANGSITNAKLANPYVTIDGTQITLGTPVVNPIWPSRSAFSVYKSTTTNNATGDGTLVNPVIFDTVIFNQGGNYNPATGIFTAPVTGKYSFQGMVTFSALNTSNSFTTFMVGTARTFTSFSTNAVNGANNFVYIPFFCIMDMTVGDTFKIQAIAVGGALDVGIIGNAINLATHFQGYLAF